MNISTNIIKLGVIVTMLVALTCGLGFAVADMNSYPLPADDTQVKSAAIFLLGHQNPDGGFGSSDGEESGLIPTCEAIMALTALNENLSQLKHSNPLPCLLANQDLLANLTNAEAQAGRFAVALAAAGVDPHNASGRDYAAVLKSYAKPSGEMGKEKYVWDDA